MAKILTDKELGDIIARVVANPGMLRSDEYEHLLEGLAELIADHFGGVAGSVSRPDECMPEWSVAFHLNGCVPDDGGVFKHYDTDVTWKNGKEE